MDQVRNHPAGGCHKPIRVIIQGIVVCLSLTWVVSSLELAQPTDQRNPDQTTSTITTTEYKQQCQQLLNEIFLRDVLLDWLAQTNDMKKCRKITDMALKLTKCCDTKIKNSLTEVQANCIYKLIDPDNIKQRGCIRIRLCSSFKQPFTIEGVKIVSGDTVILMCSLYFQSTIGQQSTTSLCTKCTRVSTTSQPANTPSALIISSDSNSAWSTAEPDKLAKEKSKSDDASLSPVTIAIVVVCLVVGVILILIIVITVLRNHTFQNCHILKLFRRKPQHPMVNRAPPFLFAANVTESDRNRASGVIDYSNSNAPSDYSQLRPPSVNGNVYNEMDDGRKGKPETTDLASFQYSKASLNSIEPTTTDAMQDYRGQGLSHEQNNQNNQSNYFLASSLGNKEEVSKSESDNYFVLESEQNSGISKATGGDINPDTAYSLQMDVDEDYAVLEDDAPMDSNAHHPRKFEKMDGQSDQEPALIGGGQTYFTLELAVPDSQTHFSPSEPDFPNGQSDFALGPGVPNVRSEFTPEFGTPRGQTYFSLEPDTRMQGQHIGIVEGSDISSDPRSSDDVHVLPQNQGIPTATNNNNILVTGNSHQLDYFEPFDVPECEATQVNEYFTLEKNCDGEIERDDCETQGHVSNAVSPEPQYQEDRDISTDTTLANSQLPSTYQDEHAMDDYDVITDSGAICKTDFDDVEPNCNAYQLANPIPKDE